MECVGIPDSGYLRFRKRLYTNALSQRIPIAGSMEITSRCNLECVHCYISGQSPDSEEMDYRELTGIVDQLFEAGCLWLVITGGEPLAHPDFQRLYRHVKSRGILPILFTNGTLLDEAIADLLAALPPYLVEVSLYGATEETCRRVTGSDDAFRRCISGVERLLERGIKVGLKTMAMTLNADEIGAMRDLAEDYGVAFRFDALLNPTLTGGRKPAEYRLEPEQVVALDRLQPGGEDEWRKLAEECGADSLEHDRIYQCGAGRSTFHIDAGGRLSVCMMSRERSWDLRRGTFMEGWNSFIPEVLEQRWTTDAPCRTCRLKSICGQCPGWGQLEHGDSEAVVDYLCSIAHLRAEVLGIGVD